MNLTEITFELLRSLSLILPIFVAGVMLIVVLKKDYFKALDVPIDHRVKLGTKRLLGDNKTWRGVIMYVVVSIIICYILQATAQQWPLAIHPIFASSPLLVGCAFSLSYVFGELTNSFIKRRLNIGSGGDSGTLIQKVGDNVDGMAAVSFVLVVFFYVSLTNILIAVTVGIILHRITDNVMRYFHLKK